MSSQFKLALAEALALAQLTVHPALAAVPLVAVDTLRELRRDIRANGLEIRMIVTPDHVLVDGRARLVVLASLGALRRAHFNVWSSTAGNLEALWPAMARGLNTERMVARRG